MENPRKFDILIQGGTLLPMIPPDEVVENPLIGISNGRIAYVEKRRAGSVFSGNAAAVIDASGCLVLPGLINAHTHLAMTAFRGLADDLPLMEWLNNHIFPAEKRFINPETVHSFSLLAMAEMILSGTTTFCDGYFFEDEVGRAALETGMRGVIAMGILDFPTPDQPDGVDKRKNAEAFLERWKNRFSLVTPSLFCHSLYTCSPQTLQTANSLVRNAGLPLQIHLAETKEEVELINERFRRKPAELLFDLGLLHDRLIAAHCIWIDDREIEMLAEHGVKAVHDPESNMKLGAGVAPLAKMLSKGMTVGLGTDGAASNNDLDLFGEIGMTAKLHKVFSGDPTVLTARQIVGMATRGGARVLGMEDRIGAIAPGMDADIILVDMKKPHLTPLYDPFSHLVYAARGADVITSIIGGKIVMKDRKLATIDRGSLLERVRMRAVEIGNQHISRN